MTSPSLPTARFDHLERMTTPDGLFEHALLAEPRRDHGYCLDDVSRGLVVAVREPEPSAVVTAMVTSYLQFTWDAQDDSGGFHNRRNTARVWTDSPTVNDHWGRALWAVGTVSALSDGVVQEDALAVAHKGMQARSPWPRAMAYAALGAAEVMRALPGDPTARELLVDVRTLLGRPRIARGWPWPEPRLTYANAVLPEALIAIGRALNDEALLAHGLDLLQWLLDLQTSSRSRSAPWPRRAGAPMRRPATPGGWTPYNCAPVGSWARTTWDSPCTTAPPGAALTGCTRRGST
jgi:hypothetical protein